mgnify:CR=1 FL=1
MESLYLLIPLSVVLVLLIGGILVWAVMSGQFEELDDVGSHRRREQRRLLPPRLWQRGQGVRGFERR